MSILTKSAIALGSIVGARQAGRMMRSIDLNDALGYIGLERRHGPAATFGATFGLIALGAAVGAGAALLLAPTSGRELRSRVGDRLQDAKSKLEHLGGNESRQFADTHS
jgi:hypothetical protein